MPKKLIRHNAGFDRDRRDFRHWPDTPENMRHDSTPRSGERGASRRHGSPDLIVRLSDLMTSEPGAFSGYQEVWDQVMCVLCFDMFHHDELEPVSDEPRKHWDVCQECALHEKQHGASY